MSAKCQRGDSTSNIPPKVKLPLTKHYDHFFFLFLSIQLTNPDVLLAGPVQHFGPFWWSTAQTGGTRVAFSEGIDTLLKMARTKHRSCLGSYETLKSSCKHPPHTFTPVRPVHVWFRSADPVRPSLLGQDLEMKGVFILFYKNIPRLLRVLFLAPALSNVDGSPFTSVPLMILWAGTVSLQKSSAWVAQQSRFFVIFSGRPRRVYHITDI